MGDGGSVGLEGADTTTVVDAVRWNRARVVVAVGVSVAGLLHLSQVLRFPTWRTPWLAILLSVAEVYSVMTLASLAWSVTRRRTRAHRPAPVVDVDVFVPTLNEPVDLLEPTVRAALAMRNEGQLRVVVLDDGARPEVAAMAERLGADYLARGSSEGAKAGNLNAGLAFTAGSTQGPAPVFAVFDADQVPEPHFLERTLGHLLQDGVAIVQTPQMYRLDGSSAVRVAHDQQVLLKERIAPCLDSFDCMFCVGTCFVARREDVEALGGFPYALTEDVALTLLLRAKGRRVAYVNERLSVGLAPPTLDAFVKQQTRWAAGTFQAWSRNLGVLRHLRPGEVWSYLSVPMNWFYGITLPIYLTVGLCDLLFGVRPFVDRPPMLLQFEILWALVALPALFSIVRGTIGIDAFLMRWGTFPITFRALWWVVRPKRARFEVSEKLHRPNERPGTGPYLLTAGAVVVAIAAALATRELTAIVVIPLVVTASNALALVAFSLRLRLRTQELPAS